MPTDLSGTPTSLGIGTYNPDVDAPSGLGFNAAMGQIDALIAARVAKPASIAAGEVPVWNGTGWDRSTTTRIGATSLGSGTPDATKFLRGDGSWQIVNTGPKVTTSSWAGGPPGSPSDTDIWIATAVDGSTGTRWHFQYNASSGSSYKWEFIGGSPVMRTSGSVFNYSVTGWQAYNGFTGFTTGRGGDYWVSGQIVGSDPATGGSHALSAGVGSALTAYGNAVYFNSQASVTDAENLSLSAILTGQSGSAVIQLLVNCGVTGVQFGPGMYSVLPVRIS